MIPKTGPRPPARQPATTSPTEGPFIASAERRGDYLRVEIAGHRSSVEAGITAWRGIGQLAKEHEVKHLLVVSRVSGPLPTADEQRVILRSLLGWGFEGVRTAFVVSDSQSIADLEHGEMEARELGQESRVFGSEKQAEVWLRYGESGRVG